ncbi:hypothetical protein CAPTEDRAFT_201942 [Capitella teleta]|uniref:Uncharacterized protein n=1 Tax=Capitella teleta TaxID=283909 RepID=R7TCC0_CAPTE|nr:hypothetical protein CAPTEDRAFT_201942 [Capitella teleta]|eukprot:ELT91363.1 hypothetical protein CAPTEDRAFT_201942 [Capitella teleta]
MGGEDTKKAESGASELPTHPEPANIVEWTRDKSRLGQGAVPGTAPEHSATAFRQGGGNIAWFVHSHPSPLSSGTSSDKSNQLSESEVKPNGTPSPNWTTYDMGSTSIACFESAAGTGLTRARSAVTPSCED